MAKKVFNMQGGLHSAAAYSALENRAWGSCVADAASLVATPGAGMSLNIAPGDGLISVDAFNARRIQVTSTETVAVPASDATYNRLDTLVAYIDNSVTPVTTVVDNINNVLKFMVVPGSAAATPSAPSEATIQGAIGAGNAYMALYNLLVPQGATNAAGVTLTDRRKLLTTIQDAQIPDSFIVNRMVAANAIKSTNIDFSEYSATEKIVGKWNNGKTLYRKTVMGSGMSGGSSIPNAAPAEATVVAVDASVMLGNGSLYTCNGTFYVGTSAWFSVNYVASNNTILFREGGTDVVTTTAHVYYTK